MNFLRSGLFAMKAHRPPGLFFDENIPSPISSPQLEMSGLKFSV